MKDIGWGGKGLYHKISDSLPVFGGNKHMRFTHKKPFDCFLLSDITAYIVICFYTPRKKKIFCYVAPEDWEEAQKESDRKSIRKEEVIALAQHYMNIGKPIPGIPSHS